VLLGYGVAAFTLALALTYGWIRWMNRIQLGQYVRDYGPNIHMHKQGTPTMGGIIFVIVTLMLSLFFTPFNEMTFFVFLAMMLFAVIGFWDDLMKFLRRESLGLKARYKFLLQAVAVGILFFVFRLDAHLIIIPATNLSIELPVWITPLWYYLVFSGSTHAFNLTDGLDGLASGLGLIALGALGMVAFVQGEAELVQLLVLFGAGMLAFLWFNRYPARVFMGDTGSFALGGLVSATALTIGMELYLFFFAVIPVLETLSVALQLTFYRFTQKRIFKITPFHHHFEAAKGVDYPFLLPNVEWSETRVTLTFWTIGAISTLIGLGIYFG
jgi:phospho-N-acetylmuramoyl-pentapeptide-transferase